MKFIVRPTSLYYGSIPGYQPFNNLNLIFSANFDEIQARQDLQDYYLKYHKPPGEPLFIPQLHHNNAITQYCPAVEQLRRDDVDRTRLHVKIYFNDNLVSQTKERYVAAGVIFFHLVLFKLLLVSF